MTDQVQPPRYSMSELQSASDTARALYIQRRLDIWTVEYETTFAALRPKVTELFSGSDFLRGLTAGLLKSRPDLIPPARYLGGPAVSADDLDVLIDAKHRAKTIADPVAARIATVILRTMDPIRFPWLTDARDPTTSEIDAAIDWTCGIWTLERVRTDRRTRQSAEQQRAVAAVLAAADYSTVPRPTGGINAIDVLERGTFTQETKVVNAKCDVPVRLRDGRLLAIECKVSGTDINSVKRLLRETGGKADTWRRTLGEEQVITAAVIGGSFHPANLAEAQQRHHIFLVWDSDMEPLSVFVQSAV